MFRRVFRSSAKALLILLGSIIALGLLGPLLFYIHKSRSFNPGARLDPTFVSVVALRVLVLYRRPSQRAAHIPGLYKPSRRTMSYMYVTYGHTCMQTTHAYRHAPLHALIPTRFGPGGS